MNTSTYATTSTPRQLRKMPMYEVLANDIKRLGIDCVFGLMSDDTVELAVTLDAIGVRFIGARHENNAIAMTEGYAAATGRLAVAMIGRGPATANGLHAAVYASRTGSKVLIIFGEAAVGARAANGVGPDYKAFNAIGVLMSAGLRVFHGSSADAVRPALNDAANAAQRGATAALLLPVDVQLTEVEIDDEAWAPALKFAEVAALPASAQSIEVAASLLRHSRRPLIIAGRGAHRAGARAELERLAERTGALFVTTARGKEMFSGHAYNLGIIGSFSTSVARRHIEQADCVVAFGAGLNCFTSSFGHSIPKVPLIQVDAKRDSVGQWLNADVAVIGDARVVAAQLCDALQERDSNAKPFHAPEVLHAIATFDIRGDFQEVHSARTVDPRALGVALDALLPEKRNLVYDAGNFLGVVPYLSVPGPDHFKFTSDFASIGMGFGAALGFAKARPEHTTVLVIGDGAFMMTISELETAAREDLPLVVVLMNDCAYGAELHVLKMHQLPVERSIFPDVDFAPIAAGFGFEAATIRSLDDLAALAPMLANPQGPILLDCKINADIMAPFMSEIAAAQGRAD